MEFNTPFNENSLPYSICSRTINKDWFGMSMTDVWSILSEQIHFIAHAYKIQIYSFIVMSNHFHLLASAPLNNLPTAMQFFLAQSSRQITKSVGRINHTWRAKYFRCQIRTDRYYLHAYKYFYRNPVEAGICRFVEEYPFSTLHGLIGAAPLIVPVQYDDTLFSDFEGTLAWLNKGTIAEHREAVRKALRRRQFRLPREANVGKSHPLESQLY